MKTKQIWIGAVVFGLLATCIVYFAVFSKKEAASSQVKPVKENGTEVAKVKAAESENSKREMSNPIVPVSEGKRAISLRVVLETGVSGYLEPNSKVDIIAYGTTIDKETKKEYRTAKLMLQNVKVLASGKSSDKKDEALKYETVTVEVTPQEGVQLSLAAKDKDGFYFMLRNAKDEGIVDAEGTKVTREVIKDGVEQ